MKNAILWDVWPCGARKYRRFGGANHLHHQSDKNRPARNMSSALELIITANVPSSPILSTLIMEAIRSSEESILQEPHGLTPQKTTFLTLLCL
jgi:hypothetical protein